jgi:hypothetical protein
VTTRSTMRLTCSGSGYKDLWKPMIGGPIPVDQLYTEHIRNIVQMCLRGTWRKYLRDTRAELPPCSFARGLLYLPVSSEYRSNQHEHVVKLCNATDLMIHYYPMIVPVLEEMQWRIENNARDAAVLCQAPGNGRPDELKHEVRMMLTANQFQNALRYADKAVTDFVTAVDRIRNW